MRFAGYCKNSSGNCVKAESLSCPSNTTSRCYKSVTTTEESGNCSKSCTYTVANNPTCGANAHITYGSNGSCGCECNYGYHQSGNSCVKDCTPQSCSSVSVPSNASCNSYCTPQYSDCSTGSSVCTSWSCNYGYHQSGNSCVADCTPKSCSSVSVPSNASCDR